MESLDRLLEEELSGGLNGGNVLLMGPDAHLQSIFIRSLQRVAGETGDGEEGKEGDREEFVSENLLRYSRIDGRVGELEVLLDCFGCSHVGSAANVLGKCVCGDVEELWRSCVVLVVSASRLWELGDVLERWMPVVRGCCEVALEGVSEEGRDELKSRVSHIVGRCFLGGGGRGGEKEEEEEEEEGVVGRLGDMAFPLSAPEWFEENLGLPFLVAVVEDDGDEMGSEISARQWDFAIGRLRRVLLSLGGGLTMMCSSDGAKSRSEELADGKLQATLEYLCYLTNPSAIGVPSHVLPSVDDHSHKTVSSQVHHSHKTASSQVHHSHKTVHTFADLDLSDRKTLWIPCGADTPTFLADSLGSIDPDTPFTEAIPPPKRTARDSSNPQPPHPWDIDALPRDLQQFPTKTPQAPSTQTDVLAGIDQTNIPYVQDSEWINTLQTHLQTQTRKPPTAAPPPPEPATKPKRTAKREKSGASTAAKPKDAKKFFAGLLAKGKKPKDKE